MEFRTLGPLCAVVSGRVVSIGSARQRAVLAVLLLSANRPVSAARLIDAVWGEQPADSAQNLLRTYVWRLRGLLTEDGERRLVTDPAGYLIKVGPGELDAAEFERLLGEGRALLARGEASTAASSLRAALALWRGEPFADVRLHDDGSVAEAVRLAESRVAALEERIEADLALGRHEALIGELQQLSLQYPLRERIAGHLMLACHRAGRQADALAAYRRTRGALVGDLGVEPGPALRELHDRILRQDPALLTIGAGRRGPERITPRQLPTAPRCFAGRAEELKALTETLDGAGPGGTVVISAINGMGGVGKTTLAVHWARQHLDRFPDGQLYVNLRGYSPGARPMSAAEALRGFLEALSVPADRVPLDLDAQTALYRSLLEGTRTLVVLDNARDTDQVRPLLPGGSTCLTLVTSRSALAGLIAAEAARPLVLDLLTDEEARALLTARLGSERTAADGLATARLVELCARLPLALSIAAARAALDPALPIADLAAQLAAARNRLDPLDIADSATDLRAVFTSSYSWLSTPAARLFRLLAVHPGPDLAAAAAASLAGLPPAEAAELVGELTGAQLLTEHAPGRYAFHDLLRAFAAELAADRDREAERASAARRMLDHYLGSACGADRLLEPTRDPWPAPDPSPGVVVERSEDYAAAWAWFEREHGVLLAVIGYAAEAGLHVYASQLPWAVATYLNRCGRWRDRLATQRIALGSALSLGDPAGQARAEHSIGYASVWLRADQDARDHLGRALELYAQLSDRAGQARAQVDLALVCEHQGDFAEALDHAHRALELYAADGHRPGQARALNSVGWYSAKLGRLEPALEHCRRALALYDELRQPRGRADTLDSLGYIHHRLGRHAEAAQYFELALAAFRRLGERYQYAMTLTNLGDVRRDAGDDAGALSAWNRALDAFDELHHPDAALVRTRLAGSSGGVVPRLSPAQ